MVGLVQSAALFTRGRESVRLVRVTRADGPSRLLVYGPGDAHQAHVLENAIECLWFQSDLERRLVAEGYQLVRSPGGERRSGRERRAATRGSDRRRTIAPIAS